MAIIVDVNNHASFVAQLQSVSAMHSMIKSTKKRFGNTFKVVMIDTGAARVSTSEKLQYHVYCGVTGRNVDIDTVKAAVYHFSIGSTTSLGVAKINISIGGLWFSFNVDVVDADVPILMSIDDMDRIGVYYNSLDDKIVRPHTSAKAEVIRLCGHSYLQWVEYIHTHFTYTEPRPLCCRFVHPNANKLFNLLKRS